MFRDADGTYTAGSKRLHGWCQIKTDTNPQSTFVGGSEAMASALAVRQDRARNGFSLVEVSVVVIIIGVLAAFGVPRLLQSVERGKASQAFKYLASVRAAQERYQARQGTYASDIMVLDMEQTAPTYFTVGTIGAAGGGSLEDTWSLTLTRSGGSAGYGAYTVTFTHDGYDAANSNIDAEINPQST
jgi:prepilin-type N-terminal cleavage/methylation domain-containing protein